MQRAPVVVLVHGAWHGPWAWEGVIERLTAEGIRTVAVDLPSKGVETALLGDLHDDAETVRASVDAAGGPALVVAHSYGGLPVSEGLADSANAAHLIYLTAFMLEPGQSLLGLRGGVEPEWWLTSEDGRTYLPDDPERVFYNDCSARGRRARRCAHRAAAQGRVRPGAARRGLAARALRRTSCASATTRSHRPCRSAWPLKRARSAASTPATRPSSRARTTCRRSSRRRLPSSWRRPRDDLDELGRESDLRGARGRRRRARRRSSPRCGARSLRARACGLRAPATRSPRSSRRTARSSTATGCAASCTSTLRAAWSRRCRDDRR